MTFIREPEETPRYDHTQKGGVVQIAVVFLVLASFMAALMLSLNDQSDLNQFQILLMTMLFIFLSVLMVSMGAFRVRVFRDTVKMNFKLGFPKRTIPLQEVETVEPVRNHPAHGWGVRYIGSGWMYNIAGLDAVELRLKNGRRFRIGTNDPDRLASVIDSRVREMSGGQPASRG